MRKIKEVLRLHHEKGLSARQVAKSLGIGRSTIQDYLAGTSGTIWGITF